MKIGSFVFLLIIQSCGQNGDEAPNQVSAEINTVTEKLHQSFFEFEILGGPEGDIFQVENSGMNGIYGLTRNDKDDLDGDEQNLFDCIQQTSPSVFQLLNLQKATNSFSDCRADIRPAYVQEIVAVVSSKEQERVILYGKFNTGEVYQEDVDEELEKLKSEIRTEVLEIKNKYSENFKVCLASYIRGINSSINMDQWLIFRNCA